RVCLSGSYGCASEGRTVRLMWNSFADATVIASALSRQAIYDSKLEVWAYELRHATPHLKEIVAHLPGERIASDRPPRSGEQTGALILSAFAEFGLHRVVGDRKAFIRASARTLVGGLPLPVPRQRVALQLTDYAQHPGPLLR